MEFHISNQFFLSSTYGWFPALFFLSDQSFIDSFVDYLSPVLEIYSLQASMFSTTYSSYVSEEAYPLSAFSVMYLKATPRFTYPISLCPEDSHF